MIERDGPLSLSRQCAVLGVSRSSQYYRPKGESAEDLALMRRMDELHMAYPFYGSRQLMRHLRREGVAAGRHRIRRLMRLMGMEATYRRPRTSVASPEHRVFPYLLRGLTISRADHVYAYATGTFSSRKMARKLEEDIAFRMLAAGNFPQHRTLCEFRRRHLQDFQAVFAEVVRLARGVGLAGFGRVSVDGTKVRANASKRKAMSYGRMVKAERRLRAEIGALLKRAEAVDEAEDARYGEDARGDELPEELKRREDRLAAIEEAKARLEAEQRAMDDARGRKPGQARNPKGGKPYKREYGEPDEKAQSNFTDPESRIMKTSSEGFQQCYNAQTVVDGENQLVVATTVTDNASDQGQLVPMVDAVADAYSEMPQQVLADANYCNERDLKGLEARDIDGYVSLAREGTAGVDPDPDKYPAKARMAEKLASDMGRRRYARRKWMAEAPVGWIKEVMGFQRFSFRGLKKVQAEWTLVCLALNIKRLHTLQAA